MSKVYIVMLGLAATVIAATSAFFSIFGLAELFAGASSAVIVMATAMEFAKFVCTGFLYRYWGHINKPIRIYLSAAIFTLMIITSTGIYGFLMNAYQVSALAWKQEMMKANSLRVQEERIQAEIKDLKSFIDNIPASRISKKFEFQKLYEPKIKELNSQSSSLQAEISQIEMGVFSTQTKAGPIIHVAKALNVDVDTVVKYLTLIFVSVFDPLAVCLIFCWNMVIRLREKYRGNELKIAAHTLMNEPVDHRYKKSA